MLLPLYRVPAGPTPCLFRSAKRRNNTCENRSGLWRSSPAVSDSCGNGAGPLHVLMAIFKRFCQVFEIAAIFETLANGQRFHSPLLEMCSLPIFVSNSDLHLSVMYALFWTPAATLYRCDSIMIHGGYCGYQDSGFKINAAFWTRRDYV